MLMHLTRRNIASATRAECTVIRLSMAAASARRDGCAIGFHLGYRRLSDLGPGSPAGSRRTAAIAKLA